MADHISLSVSAPQAVKRVTTTQSVRSRVVTALACWTRSHLELIFNAIFDAAANGDGNEYISFKRK